MVAASLEAAERKPSARAYGGSVPVHDSAFEGALAAIERLFASGVHAGGKTVIGGVGDLQRFFLGGGRVDREIGAEQLLPLVGRVAPALDQMDGRGGIAAIEPARTDPA